MNPVIKAIDGGHIGTSWVDGANGQPDTPAQCKLDGERWPCPPIRLARVTLGRRHGELRPAATACGTASA